MIYSSKEDDGIIGRVIGSNRNEIIFESDEKSQEMRKNTNHKKPKLNPNNLGLERLEVSNEVIIDIKKEGGGIGVQAGDEVEVHYLGMLTDGEIFDNSYDRGDTFSFEVGAGMVIKGWDDGLLGAKVGEERLLLIPSELGYGQRGAGNSIPPYSDLIFHVLVVGIN